MLTAQKIKITSNDKAYSINLPKDFNLNLNEEFYVIKIGDVVMMTPAARLADTLEQGAKILSEFAPDFMSDSLPESIEAAREEL